ncbi:hypothetical protein GCM10010472_38970 [Pseudonocardia halophobica]|uniref:Uncharacterized protein n=1 Tax=Pseudonocardia halophobica TaxID=29401 RepID=A0A9W6NVD4_9PSEU|nr:DUF6529 family protein [Pseudonocardia halophobica]GLL11200.1 hypothetical protein GCM10017577_23410 [Pseudonocardia halophobica]
MSRSPRTGATDLGYDPATEAGTDLPGTDRPATDRPEAADTGGYRPDYDPGRFDPPTDPNLPIVPAQPDAALDSGLQEATTSIFAAVPAQAGRDDSVDSGWADPTWGHRSWDRPDYDDELEEFDRFGGFDPGPHPYGADVEGQPDVPEVVESPGHPGTRPAALLVPTVVGVAISVGLGVYARVHEGTGIAINLAGFSSGLAAKSWLTAAAFVLVLVQLWTSMRMYGRIGKRRPAGRGTATVHRWSGRLAVLLTIPVAVHCLYALGYSDANLRVLLHSLLGCFFYGAFAAKMLVLPRHDAPRWALPVLGGLVFVVLTGLFLTSSVWFLTTKGLTF